MEHICETISLRIFTKLPDPTFIVNALNMTPTYLGIKGELLSPRNPASARRELSCWVYSLSNFSGSLDAGINTMLTLIEPLIPSIGCIRSHLSKIDLCCCVASSSEQCWFSINPESLRKLGAWGIALEVDTYLVADAEEV